MNAGHHILAIRSCFDLALIGGIEQETDEFGLPVGSGLLENAREMGSGRPVGNAAPRRSGDAAIPFQNLRGQPGLCGGQAKAAAQIDLSPRSTSGSCTVTIATGVPTPIQGKSASRILLSLVDRTATGIDKDLEQMSLSVQHAELVDPVALLAFNLDSDHLSWELASHRGKNIRERADLAALDSLPRGVLVMRFSKRRHGGQCGRPRQSRAA